MFIPFIALENTEFLLQLAGGKRSGIFRIRRCFHIFTTSYSRITSMFALSNRVVCISGERKPHANDNYIKDFLERTMHLLADFIPPGVIFVLTNPYGNPALNKREGDIIQ